MSLHKRYWHQAQAWWEEYFVDNPVAWLLRRQVGYSSRQSLSSKAQELEKALRRARIAQDWDTVQNLLEMRGAYLRGLMTPQPFWKRSDPWWAIVLWSLILLMAIICYKQGWQAQIQQQLRVPAFWLLFATLLIIVPFSYGTTLRTLLIRERENGTDAFLWLTRLTGRHMVYGAIATLVFQFQLRPYLVFIAPFVWLVGALIWGSWLRGLWMAMLVGWLFGNFAMLWLIVSVFIIPATPNNLANQLLYLLNGLFAFAIIMLGLPLFSYSSTVSPHAPVLPFAQVDMTPVWGWWRLPEWWVSLLPHAGLISLLFVAHPLWGVLQGVIYLGLSVLLTPLAIRFAEQARLRPEPEIRPDEGEW